VGECPSAEWAVRWATGAARPAWAESWADRGVPGEDATPPRAAPREKALPWDMGILRLAGVFRPVRVGWGGEVVCGRDAAGGSRHGGITSGTVGSRSVLGNCGVGRQRNGNRSADLNLRHASDMRRRNTSGENGGQRRPRSHRKASPLPRLYLETPARGHAADGIPRFFAAVPAVMSH